MSTESQSNLAIYPEDAGKTYWHETEAARLMHLADLALFDVHHYMDIVLKREDWNEVYAFRVSLGYIERRLKYAWEEQHRKIQDHLGEKDGSNAEEG